MTHLKIIQTLLILVFFSFIAQGTIDITRVVHPSDDIPNGGKIYGIADGTAGPFEVTLLKRISEITKEIFNNYTKEAAARSTVSEQSEPA